jgi:hypothetical protein
LTYTVLEDNLIYKSRRLKNVMDEEGIDEHSGFRAYRGTIDGRFATSLGLNKLNVHNFETWVVFVDLVKAFRSIPRKALLWCYDAKAYQTILLIS